MPLNKCSRYGKMQGDEAWNLSWVFFFAWRFSTKHRQQGLTKAKTKQESGPIKTVLMGELDTKTPPQQKEKAANNSIER